MASSEFSVVAILYPKKGKTDEVLSLLQDVAAYTESKEPGVLRYEINRSLRPNQDGTEEIIMIEKYRDQKSLKEHGTSEKFVAFQKTLGEKELMRQAMMLKMVGQKGGFAARL